MTPEQIREELDSRGVTMNSLAKVIGCSATAVRAVIHGECRSRDIATFIARFIDKTLDEVWPGRYPNRYRRKTSNEGLMRAVALRDAMTREAA